MKMENPKCPECKTIPPRGNDILIYGSPEMKEVGVINANAVDCDGGNRTTILYQCPNCKTCLIQ